MNLERLACLAGLIVVSGGCADRMTAAEPGAPQPSTVVELLQGAPPIDVRGPAPLSGARIRICNFVRMVPEHPPLYVVNGRKLSHNDIHAMAIDPRQIEQLKIIRGAAARELYGEEAINGVVLITLKH